MKNKSILFLITGFLLGSIPLLTVTFAEDEHLIPGWIKNTAKFWVEGGVSDKEFLNALQFLVKEGMLEIPEPEGSYQGLDQGGLTLEEALDEIEKINLENEYSPSPREWITSGPFQIDRSKYLVGEKIFLVIGGLENKEKGQAAFLRPLNDTHYKVYQTVPFDGAKKNAFNYYIQPQISKVAGICSMDDITGNWTIVFRGTDYANLKFEITDKILPGEEDNYQPVC